MLLTSTAFTHGSPIPRKYTCQGDNTPPPLAIADVPPQAKSLVLLVDDPDVPASLRPDQMWDHWVLFNIPPATRAIENGVGTLGLNTSGKKAYEGPCPPDREHRYYFKLYALNCSLPLAAGATKAQVLHAMQGHILAEAQLMGRYNKS